VTRELTASEPGSDDSIRSLQRAIAAFVAARDWQQFHAAKNLAAAISVEAGELLAHFRWLDERASDRVVDDPATLEEIRLEIADVLILTFELADRLGIDPASAVRSKLAVNESRYPVDLAKGRSDKYTKLS
jgi:NTP pyrophosphatase (non-canonical NTP hydrolase)